MSDSVMLSSNWESIARKYKNFDAGTRLEGLVNILAEEMYMTVLQQMDQLIYNTDPPPSAGGKGKVNAILYAKRGGRSGQMRKAVSMGGGQQASLFNGAISGSMVGGAEVLDKSVGGLDAIVSGSAGGVGHYATIVQVDPDKINSNTFYPYLVDRGTRYQAPKPFWRNSVVIMSAKRKRVLQQNYFDMRASLALG